jgi:general secretion pathway protein J
VHIHPLSGWQLFVHRGGSWTNPLSSDAGGANKTDNPTATVPDGVRLVLTLPAVTPVAGTVTLDWVRPNLSGGGG